MKAPTAKPIQHESAVLCELMEEAMKNIIDCLM